jgi:hypothetical protein
MKKTFLVIMLAVSIIPQETLCAYFEKSDFSPLLDAHLSRLPEMLSFLDAEGEKLMEEWCKQFPELSNPNSIKSKMAEFGLTFRLGSAVHEKFLCTIPRHHIDCREIQPILETRAQEFIQNKIGSKQS